MRDKRTGNAQHVDRHAGKVILVAVFLAMPVVERALDVLERLLEEGADLGLGGCPMLGGKPGDIRAWLVKRFHLSR